RAANSGARYALRFDPELNSFIRTNKLFYDGSHPITLEAYVIPLTGQRQQGTIISDAEGSGMEIVVRPKGVTYLAANSGGQYHTIRSQASLTGRRTHLAGVLEGRQLSFFVGGKKQGSFTLPGPFKSSPLPFYVGANPNRDGSA